MRMVRESETIRALWWDYSFLGEVNIKSFDLAACHI